MDLVRGSLEQGWFIWIGFLVWFWSHPLHNQPLFDGSVEGTNSHGVSSLFDYFPQTQRRSNIFHPDMKRFSLVFSMEMHSEYMHTLVHHVVVITNWFSKELRNLFYHHFSLGHVFIWAKVHICQLGAQNNCHGCATKVLRDCDVDSLLQAGDISEDRNDSPKTMDLSPFLSGVS